MKNKFCYQCGHEVDASARFCPSCGTLQDKKGKLKAKGVTRDVSGIPKKINKSNTMRDSLIVVALIAVSTLGYALIKESPTPPQPPEQQVQRPAGHEEGMSMAMIDQVPNDFKTLVSMGNQFMDEGNFPVAAELYRRALLLEDSHNVRTDYGACLHGMGLSKRAIEEFQKVLANHPEHGIANYNLGIVYRSVNQLDSARFYWEKYLTMEPEGQASHSARELLKELGG